MSKSFLLLFFKKEVLLLPSCLLVFLCTWIQSPGSRHYGIFAALIVAGCVFARRLRLPPVAGLPWLIAFLALVGIGGMVNHGAVFAAMSHDFWHADLLVAPDRRPVLPAIAAMLPPWPAPYIVVWYGCFVALFLTAWHRLGDHGLTELPRFSGLSASIVAYLLVIPGYSEVLTFLVALLCWRADLTAGEKCLAAAVMIGGHEVAAVFSLLFLAIEDEARGRRQWLGVGALLFAVYAAGYVLSAGAGLGRDLATATHAASGHPLSAWQLDVAHPFRCALGVLAAYKLMWLLLPAALIRPGRVRLHAACVLLALPLVLVAVDTSRVVQFASLSMFGILIALPPRRWLCVANLALPSLCVGTLAIPAWGKGLYAVYLLAARMFGLSIGGMAF